MNKLEVTRYQCSICKEIYASEEAALQCESRPVSQDKGVKIGDIVTILDGDGAGKEGKVTEVSVINRNWGHYAWERYWHTVGLTVDIIGSYGSRFLTFDAYRTKN